MDMSMQLLQTQERPARAAAQLPQPWDHWFAQQPRNAGYDCIECVLEDDDESGDGEVVMVAGQFDEDADHFAEVEKVWVKATGRSITAQLNVSALRELTRQFAAIYSEA